jgi:hypothetical protein
MSYFKKAMIWGLKFGIPIGLAIGFTFILIFSGIYGGCSATFGYLLKQYVISAIVGFGCSALPVVYTIESWSKLKQTAVHFTSMICLYMPCAIIAGWMPLSPIPIASFTAIYIVIYIMYWFAFYFYWKHKIRKLNSVIKEKIN